MHYINGAYTNYVNRKRNRSGHLFQGGYKAILVDQDSFFGTFSVNFEIPDYWGIGKSVSRGFGTIQRVKR